MRHLFRGDHNVFLVGASAKACDAVAHAEALDLGTKLGHNADGLMAQNIAGLCRCPGVEFRVTHSGDGNLHQHLVFIVLGNGDLNDLALSRARQDHFAHHAFHIDMLLCFS